MGFGRFPKRRTGLSKSVSPTVDGEVTDSVSVHLAQAGTSGRTADGEMSKWASGKD